MYHGPSPRLEVAESINKTLNTEKIPATTLPEGCEGEIRSLCGSSFPITHETFDSPFIFSCCGKSKIYWKCIVCAHRLIVWFILFETVFKMPLLKTTNRWKGKRLRLETSPARNSSCVLFYWASEVLLNKAPRTISLPFFCFGSLSWWLSN